MLKNFVKYNGKELFEAVWNYRNQKNRCFEENNEIHCFINLIVEEKSYFNVKAEIFFPKYYNWDLYGDYISIEIDIYEEEFNMTIANERLLIYKQDLENKQSFSIFKKLENNWSIEFIDFPTN